MCSTTRSLDGSVNTREVLCAELRGYKQISKCNAIKNNAEGSSKGPGTNYCLLDQQTCPISKWRIKHKAQQVTEAVTNGREEKKEHALWTMPLGKTEFFVYMRGKTSWQFDLGKKVAEEKKRRKLIFTQLASRTITYISVQVQRTAFLSKQLVMANKDPFSIHCRFKKCKPWLLRLLSIVTVSRLLRGKLL